MEAAQSKEQEVQNPAKHASPSLDHRKFIADHFAAVKEQEIVMARLVKDLNFFRNQYKECLNYDNGTGDYTTDYGEEEIDLRWYAEPANGTVSTEAAIAYVQYRTALENFQKALEKWQNEVNDGWDDIQVVRDVDNDKLVQRSSLKMPKWAGETLEAARKTAM